MAMNPGVQISWLVLGCPHCHRITWTHRVFLIKIYNPQDLDEIDRKVIEWHFVTEEELQNGERKFWYFGRESLSLKVYHQAPDLGMVEEADRELISQD